MSAPDLAIIIVSYNVRALLGACLESAMTALARSGLRGTIIVVDNASTDGSAALVRTAFPGLTLLESGANLGFAGANNLALRHLGFGAADTDTPTAVLLLNPDTLVEPDAIAELWRALELDAGSGPIIVGPRLRYADGSVQSSRRRFPTRATLFWEATLLEQWWPGNPWARRYHLADQPATDPQTVDWLVGAALLVRADAIRAGGLLDERFFLYSEELEWQQRLHRATGGRIVYWPAATIWHYEGRSSEQNLARRQINFFAARCHYAAMTFGALTALLVRWFVWLTFAVQSLVEAAKWLLGHRRALRRDRLAQYRAVLGSLGGRNIPASGAGYNSHI